MEFTNAAIPNKNRGLKRRQGTSRFVFPKLALCESIDTLLHSNSYLRVSIKILHFKDTLIIMITYAVIIILYGFEYVSYNASKKYSES